MTLDEGVARRARLELWAEHLAARRGGAHRRCDDDRRRALATHRESAAGEPRERTTAHSPTRDAAGRLAPRPTAVGRDEVTRLRRLRTGRQLPDLRYSLRGAHAATGTQISIAPGSSAISSDFRFSRSPPSTSYERLAVELHLDPLAQRVCWTNGDLAAVTQCGARDRPGPFRRPSAVPKPSSSMPSSGRASSNASMPAEEIADVADE